MLPWNPTDKKTAQRMLRFRPRLDELSRIGAIMDWIRLKAIPHVPHGPAEASFPLAAIIPLVIFNGGKIERRTGSNSRTSGVPALPFHSPIS